MAPMSTTTRQIEARLREVSRRNQEQSAAIERLEKDLAELKAAATPQRVSPSVPLDAPEPNAAITYSAEAYDALMRRLDAPANPNERLRKTMAGHLPPPE
jgi:uncharacterized protein (DUF1778 family)